MLELMITEGNKQKGRAELALRWFQKMEDY
jgi:hypothetical protein